MTTPEDANAHIEREVWFQEARKLRMALERIEGGFVPNGGNLIIGGDWHGFANGLQAIAREALGRS